MKRISNEEVYRDRLRGLSYRELEARHHICRTTLNRILKAHVRAKRAERPKRDAAIRRDRKSGMTLAAIAAKHDISPSLVSSVICDRKALIYDPDAPRVSAEMAAFIYAPVPRP